MLQVCLGGIVFSEEQVVHPGTFQELVAPVFVAGGGDQSKALESKSLSPITSVHMGIN